MSNLYVIVVAVVVVIIVALLISMSVENHFRHITVAEAYKEFEAIIDSLEKCKTKRSVAEVADRYYVFVTKWTHSLSNKEYEYYSKTFAEEMKLKREELSK